MKRFNNFTKTELEILCEELGDEFSDYTDMNDTQYGDRQQIRQDLFNEFKKELELKDNK